MVYPDLDVFLIKNSISKKDFSELIRDLSEQSFVRGLSFIDNINFALINRVYPKGYWIGIEIPFEDDRWGIDCWFVQPDWENKQPGNYSEQLTNIDQTTKDTILAIKYDLIYKGLYGKSYHSSDVYEAVLEKKVSSLEDFYNSMQPK